MPDWDIDEVGTVALVDTTPSTTEISRAEKAFDFWVKESFADLETLYREDVGWQKLGHERTGLTSDGRARIAALADLSIVGNALIKRGTNLRTAYIWGQGVKVKIRISGADGGQDIAGVWNDFWDEPSNRREFSSPEAQFRYERRLVSSGEVFWALPTDPETGKVKIRKIPSREIVDRLCNPEDVAEVWFYKRAWTVRTVNFTTGREETEQRTTYYPALGFDPLLKPPTILGDEVRWDAPMRPVIVNVPDLEWRGVGDALAAMPWAKMDKEFLEDLALYMRALTRILGQVTGRNSKAAAAAAKAMSASAAATAAPGSWAVTDPNTSLSLMSKSGAQIDADSSKPFATRVASAMEVPLTMLLGDPGVTGARATAETLDPPTELMARMRQQIHEELFRDISGYVIDQAVRFGNLNGTEVRNGSSVTVVLPDGDDKTLQTEWPDYSSTPLDLLVGAIVEADTTDALPRLEIFRLLAQAFGLDNLDELMKKMTDANGNFIDPRTEREKQTALLAQQGQDQASREEFS